MNQHEHDTIIEAWRRDEYPLVRGGQGRTDSEVEEQSGLIVGAMALVGAAALAGFLIVLAIGGIT